MNNMETFTPNELKYLKYLDNNNIWLEYKYNLYLLRKDSCYCNTLILSNIFYKEVIRGFSGVTKFGSHVGELNPLLIKDILRDGIEWSEDKIKSRLRYSIRDGGKVFNSIRDRYQNYINKLKNKILRYYK